MPVFFDQLFYLVRCMVPAAVIDIKDLVVQIVCIEEWFVFHEFLVKREDILFLIVAGNNHADKLHSVSFCFRFAAFSFCS